MNFILTLAYLFFVGSVSGWVLELFFRKFFSASNPEHKWINPGFCTGPYLPIYGFGLCALYLLALLGSGTGLDGSIQGRALLFLGMAVSMTLIEYLPAVFLLLGTAWHSILFFDPSAHPHRARLALGEPGVFLRDRLILWCLSCGHGLERPLGRPRKSLCRCERRDREGRESQSPYPSRTGTGFHARSFLFRFSLRASPRRTSEGGA